jgi:8-oxo-dGTP pyrophosphatase MutT (NUDIX family)
MLEALFVPNAQRIPRIEREWIQRTQPVRHAERHVAAVCYRLRNGEIEFLLVRTRAGRWTFPKGRVDADSTRAAAAAREAYEEAGVYGRVEMVAFSTYLHSKGSRFRRSRDEHRVAAHLCEVLELETPEESYRNPTWFSVEKSKRRLHQDRTPRYGLELARIVDHAVERISHCHRKLLHR